MNPAGIVSMAASGSDKMNNTKAITSLKVVSVWLNNLRDERDLQQAINKIDEVIKTLEEEERRGVRI